MSESFLVLGGAGFIGSHLVRQLVLDGHNVKVYSRSGRSIFNLVDILDDIDLIYGDLMDTSTLSKALTGVNNVIHLISTTFPGTTLNSGIYDISSNLVPTVNLLELCRQKGISKVIYASSGGTVYGEPIFVPVDEAHPLNPISIYGQSKKAIESYLEFFSRTSDLTIQILRLSNPFGPCQNSFAAQGVIAVAMGCILDNRPFNIIGDGSAVRDYIYIDDVVQAFKMSLLASESDIYNISNEKGKSVLEILSAIEKISGRSFIRHFLPARQGDVRVNVLSNRKAQEQLNWVPETSFDDAILKSWQWYSSKN